MKYKANSKPQVISNYTIIRASSSDISCIRIMMTVTYKCILAIAVFSLVAITGCKKFIEVDPPIGKTSQENVYNNDANAIAVLTGIYTKMSQADLSVANNLPAISLYTGLAADEFTLFGTEQARQQYFLNQLTPGTIGTDFWNPVYQTVFVCNNALEALSASVGLSQGVKQQLEGEAKFIRAFCYFYLINLYSDVPLVISTNWKMSTAMPRTNKDLVYAQITSDLKDAQILLSNDYLDKTLLATTAERVRPTKSAASAMLARTYFYMGDWPKAEAEATAVINNITLYDIVSLNNVFLKNSKESIWQLQPVNSGRNTQDAWVFKLLTNGPDVTHPVYLNSDLLNSFETQDSRKSKWVDSVRVKRGVDSITYYYPNKYKSAKLNDPLTEYSTVLRLGEQYLIRAEAKARQNKLSEAITDLDKIRSRAQLPLLAITNPGISQEALLNTILHERQVELFTEWGHRWFDLKRTGSIDAVMSTATLKKGGTWVSYQQLFPISLSEISLNPNLEQNKGY